MTLTSRTGLAAALVLLLGTGVEPAAAMPHAPVAGASESAAAVDQVAYGLHRRYPGYNSPMARRFRHARRMSPNRYCRNQPSRCR